MLTIAYIGHVNYAAQQETKTKLVYPLSLLEVKRHLRLDSDFTDDDDYLDTLIEAATQSAESFIEKDIAKTQTVLRIDDFYGDWVRINDGNFLNVVSVVDANDASIGTIKQTSKHSDFFQIEWTSTVSSDPLTITYYSGFNENETPAVIKQAILVIIANLYDSQRSDIAWGGLTDSKLSEKLLQPYRSIRF